MQRDFGTAIDHIYDSRRLIRAGYSYNSKVKNVQSAYSIGISGHNELRFNTRVF